MIHKGTVTLETERLILRRFTPGDAEAMFRNWAGDPEVTKFLTWQTHPNVEESRKIVAMWADSYDKTDTYLWAIVPKDLGEPIGSIGVVNLNESVGSAEIGYCIGKAWWRKGYTSEALRKLVCFFFTEVGINRVESRHDTNNPNSGRVMRKAGLVYEGMRRKADRNNQGIVDTCIYGIISEDLPLRFFH
jgi:ribosomal-protein-alanine N-acetyltransferase